MANKIILVSSEGDVSKSSAVEEALNSTIPEEIKTLLGSGPGKTTIMHHGKELEVEVITPEEAEERGIGKDNTINSLNLTPLESVFKKHDNYWQPNDRKSRRARGDYSKKRGK